MNDGEVVINQRREERSRHKVTRGEGTRHELTVSDPTGVDGGERCCVESVEGSGWW